jgi:hypothetical protein
MRNAWCLVLPLLLGCSGKHVVAGEDKTTSEQFAASLPSWCENFCKTYASCAGATPCDCTGGTCRCENVSEADCREDCQEELGRYKSGGDTCAEIGLRFQRCLDELTCTQLVESKAEDCEPTDEEERQCPGDHDAPIVSDPGGPAGPPPSVGGTVATGVGGAGTIGGMGSAGEPGGTAGLGGATGGTGSDGGAPADPVSCQGSYGVGGTGSGSGIICEEGRMRCSDGHDYGWMCARGSNLELACSCFVDGALTRGFDPASDSCPSVERVNTACGFYLPD